MRTPTMKSRRGEGKGVEQVTAKKTAKKTADKQKKRGVKKETKEKRQRGKKKTMRADNEPRRIPEERESQ